MPHVLFNPLRSDLNTTTVLCWPWLNTLNYLFPAIIMNWSVFLYNFHKMEETLLRVMKIWSERIKGPTNWIPTVWNIFYDTYRERMVPLCALPFFENKPSPVMTGDVWTSHITCRSIRYRHLISQYRSCGSVWGGDDLSSRQRSALYNETRRRVKDEVTIKECMIRLLNMRVSMADCCMRNK
jgi:hypothetical protein